MDIRNFFGKAAAKTKTKPTAARPSASSSAASASSASKPSSASKQSTARTPSSSAQKPDGSSGKKAERKAATTRPSSSSKKSSPSEKGRKNRRLVIDDSDGDTTDGGNHDVEVREEKEKREDEEKARGKVKKAAPVAGREAKKKPTKSSRHFDSNDDSATTDDDDGGLGDIIKTVTTPDRKRPTADDSDETTDDDDGGSGGSAAAGKPRSTSKGDWEAALNYTPEKKKKSAEKKKRKTPESGRRGRRLEVSAEDFFAAADGGSGKKKKEEAKKEKAAERKEAAEEEDDFMSGDDDDVRNNRESDAKNDADGDYVDSKSESDTDDDLGASRPRRKKTKKAATASDGKKPLAESDEDGEDAALDVSVVTESSSAPSPSSPRRSPRKKRGAADVLEVGAGTKDDDDDDDVVVMDASDDAKDDENYTEEEEAKKSRQSPSKAKAKKKAEAGAASPKRKKAKSSPSPTKRAPASSAKKKKGPAAKAKKEPPVRPAESVESYPTESATPGCLEGLTFVFTGVMPNLGRTDAEDYVKILGGRATGSVSGRTNYLVCGDVLEDGRGITEGSKYRKAKELGEEKVAILHGEGELYGLTKLMDERARANMPGGGSPGATASSTDAGLDGGAATAGAGTAGYAAPVAAAGVGAKAPAPSPAVAANPYAKKPAGSVPPRANPYANPYAKKPASSSAPSANPYAKKPAGPAPGFGGASGGGRADINDPSALWADKYAPKTSREILGNGECVRKLTTWLARWEDTFNNPKARGKTFSTPNGPWKAALLSGPPGIGKTTTAMLVAKESGREVLELNASDTRSKKSLSESLGDVTGSQVLSFAPPKKKQGRGSGKKRCIIMDEVDGMGAGDRSGMSELIKMIKQSHVPIICICNDRQSQKIRSLVSYCMDLRYRRPVKTVIARRAVEVGQMEGMRVEQNAAEAIAESCGNDIRQVLNCLQMWSSKKQASSDRSADMTYKDVKERQSFVNKDEILRVSMFDATKSIIEGPRGLSGADEKAKKDSLYKRSDAYFTDYGLMGLNVHQNYLKVMVSQFQETKRKNDMEAELKVLERMHSATESMSDFALAEQAVRGGDQNWGLLPLCAMLCVKTGHHAGGENGGFLPGFPEFAGWLGKNSSRGRKTRMLHELGHHMNYRVSADTTELRLGYVPALREGFLNLMMDKEGSRTEEVIELMDEYGLDRDDLFEKLDEFTLNSKAQKFASLDSKTKAAFTREYNKGVHKSQALVDEQGVVKSKKKAANGTVKESEDPDVVNEDGSGDPEEDDEDDEMDAEAIKKLFKKVGRGNGKGKGKGGKGANSKKAKVKKK